MRLPDFPDCCGCGACVHVCPRRAIQLVADSNGFLHPRVDKIACVSCGLCAQACPVLLPCQERLPISCYAARSPSESLRLASSSGGLFSEFAKHILSVGGVVYGCILDNRLVACHIRTESFEGLSPMRGSKYVQSDLRLVFVEIRRDLDGGRFVLFSGTPCQIAGLISFLGRKDDRLLTLAIVCHGVVSPKVFEQYKKYLEKRYRARLKRIEFRKKSGSWKRFQMACLFQESSQSMCEVARDNLYFKAFDLALRDCCHRCSFRNGRSGCDVMIGDFWGIENVLPDMDDDSGTSCVLVYTDKGSRLFDSLDVEKSNVEFSLIVHPRNPMIIKDVPQRKWRCLFLYLNRNFGFAFAWRVVDLGMRVVEKAKALVLCKKKE